MFYTSQGTARALLNTVRSNRSSRRRLVMREKESRDAVWASETHFRPDRLRLRGQTVRKTSSSWPPPTVQLAQNAQRLLARPRSAAAVRKETDMKRMGRCNRCGRRRPRNTSACTQPLGPACLRRSPPATSETSAFFFASRKCCCSPIGNITVWISLPTPLKWPQIPSRATGGILRTLARSLMRRARTERGGPI
jgi:hypothetical protein